MENLTNEQIEQKKLLLSEKMKEAESLYKELVDAGALELTEEALDKAVGASRWSQEEYNPFSVPRGYEYDSNGNLVKIVNK